MNPAEFQASLGRIVGSRRGTWRRGTSVVASNRHIDSIGRVALPLARDGRTVDMILCMTVFHWGDKSRR